MGGTIQHLTQLVGAGVLPPFCNLLEAKDWNVIIVVLDGLTNILHAAEKIGQAERVAIMIEEIGGLDKIEALQHHENEKVYQKSMAIIDTFFSQRVCTLFYVHKSKIVYIRNFILFIDSFIFSLNKRIFI